MSTPDRKLKKLNDLYEAVRTQTLSSFRPGNDDADAVIDLELFESYLAGIAEKLCCNKNATQEERTMLMHRILEGTYFHPFLRNVDGTPRPAHDLSHLPFVLEYARNIEELRKICLEISNDKLH